MRIIQITPEFPPNCGGIGYYVFYLSKELIKMGHDISVILRSRNGSSYNHKLIPVRKVKAPGISPLNLSIFAKKLEKILAQEKKDLVHIHSSVMPVLNCHCPVMVTAHWCNKEGIPAFHRPIKDLDSLYRNIMLPIYTKIESKLAKSCQKLTVVSDSLRKEFEKHYNIESDVIYNAVDMELFNFNPEINKENAILFTGKLGSGKGILDLLKIAEMLKKSHSKTKLYIIGNGPLKNSIKKGIKKNGLNNVEMISQLKHPELIKYYQRAKIFVLPTYYEGFPTTVLEAMACALPVIATNVSGIPEQIDEGVNGFMITPGDIQSFYKRIVELLESPEKRLTMGQNARKKVFEKFTWNRVAKKIADMYEQMLK